MKDSSLDEYATTDTERHFPMPAIYLLIAFGLGALVSMQPAINAQIAARLGGPLFAAVCSITISLVMVTAAWATFGRVGPQWSKLLTLPWWTLIGGAAGALFVLIALVIVPKLGVAMFFVCVVLGQLLGAAYLDHIGAFGMEMRTLSWSRVLGIALVIVGVAVTQVGSWLEA
ncbi:DMT family transporter [Paracoccus alkanivorans]|uniref:DMT family transporter n=1 Tax=Paracoccus alkanivorans TaxID=2116655 RepID=A0A3M0MF83_9RHOB|nr:DMT family transporter [Paracoccus alkanivorans]RMC36045.1 DMT family transporter [Paracoccus alkanivorans]